MKIFFLFAILKITKLDYDDSYLIDILVVE